MVMSPPVVSRTPYMSTEAYIRRRALRLLGLKPSEKPWVLSVHEVHPHQLTSLRFPLLGYSYLLILAPLQELSSHVLNCRVIYFLRSLPFALQSINRPAAGNKVNSRGNSIDVPTLLGFPHRSFPWHLDMNTPGYEFTSSGA